ncbi:enoyl-CoA hydratase/isomerase family protein [Amycolatopsis echigonensis]|uniref:Enoyl-CoA hydratase/isomerase family protein n=1 Tax=Amycolatopsis echigonensis TaxID=2576905 RepID=A0A8E1W1F6_9PSEU|nr:enoyl-CoA hydratase-related protein [Amycolatopsis echigonensis]MBB2502315.1 enoyl-CoA hydratase/isomerase family protein [Amycolatopsis echigonensis]
MAELKPETMELSRPEEGIVVATLNRPESLNSMTVRMFAELEELAFALGDDDETRVLIVTGAGKAFCAGYDLDDADELTGLTALGMLERQEHAVRALSALRSLRIPVIAAVNGAAAGGGLALALAADIRLAAESAKFNAAFVRIGLSAGDLGSSWLLPRLIGPALASEIAYTGRFVFAEEAERIGLVNRVVPGEKLLDETIAMARLIRANSPGGVQLSKRALQANLEITSYAAALELENRGQALLTRSEDMPEALAAFKEKRAPKFTGR